VVINAIRCSRVLCSVDAVKQDPVKTIIIRVSGVGLQLLSTFDEIIDLVKYWRLSQSRRSNGVAFDPPTSWLTVQLAAYKTVIYDHTVV
jgi:hypothetical protein